MGDHNVPGTALRILRVLLVAGPATANELAKTVHRHPKTVRDALHRLAAHGLAIGTAPRPYTWNVGPVIRGYAASSTPRARS